MKRGVLIGLAVGFALGVGLGQVFRSERVVGPAPPPAASGGPAAPHSPAETPSGGRSVAPKDAVQPAASRDVAKAGRDDRGDPHPQPEESGRSRNLRPEWSFTTEELIEGLRTILSGGSLGLASSPLWEGQKLSSVLWSRHGADRPSRVPSDVVAALLDSGDAGLRVVGAGLVALSDPPMLHRIRELALEDPDIRIRLPAVGTIDRIARRHPELIEVLTAAAKDRALQVRCQALGGLANLCAWRPDLGEWVVAGTRDPNADVREYATHLLRMAGPAGIERATELLLEGSFDLESLEHLIDAALEGDGLREILNRNPTPEVVTTLIGRLDSEEDEARVIKAFAGRFREMLALYQPGGGDCGEFFRLAADAGELDLLREVITSGEYEHSVRLDAVRVSAGRKDTEDLAVAAVHTALRDPESPARFRVELFQALHWSLAGDSGARALVRKIAKEVARDDPSAWVREAARQFLE